MFFIVENTRLLIIFNINTPKDIPIENVHRNPKDAQCADIRSLDKFVAISSRI
jgi:hypothetical protein